MQPDEALAVCRLRAWAADKVQLRSGRTTDYRREGWQKRNDRTFNARIIRVIDFERALSKLDGQDQALLTLVYRDREDFARIALALHCSTRTVSTHLPEARKRLAEALSALDLL